jgi:cobalt-zinc-cadmium efflux system membrane fusion protein
MTLRQIHLFGGLLACLAVNAYGTDALQVTAEQSQTMGIELYEVARSARELSDPLAAQLVLSDQHQRVLSLPVSGKVQELYRVPGAVVAAGDELGLVRSREALALQREYLGAIDQLERSTAAKKRDAALFKGGAISSKRWQQTLSEWRQDDALAKELASQLAALGIDTREQKALRQTRQIRSLLPLRAPMDGVIIERGIEPGESFAAGQQLFHLGDAGQLWLSILAPQQLAAKARVGDSVYLDGRTVGSVLQVGAAIEPDSQSVMLTASLEPADSTLLPGQSLLVQLGFTEREGLWLPRNGPVNIGGKTVVFIAQADGYALREIDAAPALEGWTALSGLSAGDQVVASGSAALKGMVMGLGGAGDDAQ